MLNPRGLSPAALAFGLLLLCNASAFAQESARTQRDGIDASSQTTTLAASPGEGDDSGANATDAEAGDSIVRKSVRAGEQFDEAAHLVSRQPSFPLDAMTLRAASAREASASGGQANHARRPPLSDGEKVKRAFRGAFLSPQPYLFSAFSATVTQLGEEDQPHKTAGDEFADGASRFARSFATRSTRTVFASGIYPALFNQDPRYERATGKGAARRTLHAVSRVFVTRGDDGDIEPNYSRFAGVMTASALANIWEQSTPGRDRVGVDATLRRFAFSFVYDAVANIVLREFWPDIIGIFRK